MNLEITNKTLKQIKEISKKFPNGYIKSRFNGVYWVCDDIKEVIQAEDILKEIEREEKSTFYTQEIKRRNK